MDSCQQSQMDGWVQVSWQISPVHYGLRKKSYKTKDLWVLKGHKISSGLVSNKSNAGEAFLWFSEHCRGDLSLSFFSMLSTLQHKVQVLISECCWSVFPKLAQASVKNSCLQSDSEASKSNLPWHMQRECWHLDFIWHHRRRFWHQRDILIPVLLA